MVVADFYVQVVVVGEVNVLGRARLGMLSKDGSRRVTVMQLGYRFWPLPGRRPGTGTADFPWPVIGVFG